MRIGRTALVFVLVGVTWLGVSTPAAAGGGGDSNAKPLPPKASGEPFTEPQRLTSANGVLQFDLVAKNGGITVAGAAVKGRAYSADLVGPTLLVNPGDTIALTLDNQLPAHTNLHFNGLHVSPMGNSDNIFLEVHPGERFAYSVKIPADHPAGTRFDGGAVPDEVFENRYATSVRDDEILLVTPPRRYALATSTLFGRLLFESPPTPAFRVSVSP